MQKSCDGHTPLAGTWTLFSKFCTIPISAFTSTLNWKWSNLTNHIFHMGWLKPPVPAEAIWPRMWYSPLHLLCSRTSLSRSCRHLALKRTPPRWKTKTCWQLTLGKKWWRAGKVTMFLLRNGGRFWQGTEKLQIFGSFHFQFHKHRNDPLIYPDWWISYALLYPQEKSMGTPSVFGWWFPFKLVVHGGFGSGSQLLRKQLLFGEVPRASKSIEIFCFFLWISATGLLKAPWF